VRLASGPPDVKVARMNLTATLPVHCVNCGSSDALSLAVRLIGVIVAAIALVVSVFVWRIMRREHEEFLKQLTARA
jgi:sensor domain CHASE-containing protein